MSSAAELWDKAARYRRMLIQIDDDQARSALMATINDLEAEASQLAKAEQAKPEFAMQEIYASENGDCWFLVVDKQGLPRVLHRANAAAGGHETGFAIDTFLTTNGRHTPQHKALLRLIGRLAAVS